jgi:membrane dipeptidase
VVGSPHGKKGKVDGVVMINFTPYFIANPEEANVKRVADHVEHIAKIAGKKQYIQLFQSVLGERLGSLSVV